jgi:hypothetical protein
MMECVDIKIIRIWRNISKQTTSIWRKVNIVITILLYLWTFSLGTFIGLLLLKTNMHQILLPMLSVHRRSYSNFPYYISL